MKKLNHIKLIFIFLFGINGLIYSQNQTFRSFLDLFRIDTLPFNSIEIRDNKNFIDHKTKFKIPRQYVIKYLIKDTSELWHPEPYESIIHEGEFDIRIFETDFYKYCYFFRKNFYLIIYNKEIPEESFFYLKIYDKSGVLITNFQLTGHGQDTYFNESKINSDLSIEKVTYTYIDDKKTKIDVETYLFDTAAKNYKLSNKKQSYSNHFYYDYVNHKLDDDPFKIVEK